ncbi:hypothetical protein [Stomatohabitans albus]|uniref:hypothetical protein n=1 Tax=Stomatohabitans albus TaxID=3110766 RepID=UPI00300D6D8A
MADDNRSVSPVILIVGGLAILGAAIYALYTFVLAPQTTGANDVAQAPSAEVTLAPTDGASASDVPADGQGDGATASPDAPLDGTPAEGDQSGQVLPETFEVYTSRNPFEQLIRQGEEGERGGARDQFDGGSNTSQGGSDGLNRPTLPPAAITPPSSDGRSPVPSRPGTGTPTAVPAAPGASNSASPSAVPVSPGGTGSNNGTSNSAGTGAGGQVEVGATRVRLQSVDPANKAVVTVNGVDYNPSVGEQFAQRFKLLSVQTTDGKDCATMLFGDSRFSICAGQVIDK